MAWVNSIIRLLPGAILASPQGISALTSTPQLVSLLLHFMQMQPSEKSSLVSGFPLSLRRTAGGFFALLDSLARL